MRVYRNVKLRQLGIKFCAPRPGDAGYDLFSIENYLVGARKRVLVESGLHIEIPSGYVGLVKDRSSVAAAGLHTLAGVIDSAYRGELKILMVNLADEDIQIHAGQNIAQLLVVPVGNAPVEFVDSLEDLSKTERGSGGFGSTGE
ncbi:MAG: dUTP diphosphatase [Chloroflexota bacterium]|nr:dUTP diphosphatase [Chloroflexota bacterium]